MKKFIVLILALALIMCMAASALADVNFAGEVKLNDPSSYLRMRKGPGTSYGTKAYMKHGTSVTINDVYVNGTNFHKITGYSYTNHSSWTGGATRTGYASADYIVNYG